MRYPVRCAGQLWFSRVIEANQAPTGLSHIARKCKRFCIAIGCGFIDPNGAFAYDKYSPFSASAALVKYFEG
jgi:hypothetical protein